ncbi:MAG TPA: hypothetical protein VIL17_00220 [Coriobacteriia bacterium]
MGKEHGSLRSSAKIGAFVAILALAMSVPNIALAAMQPVYRFYNVVKGVHFYTASETEKANVVATLSSIYRLDGVAYTIDTSDPANSHPLYRFYNVVTGVHFYTSSETEKANVIATMASTYRFEGVAYNVSADTSGLPVYRFYNVKKKVHFYTASETEKANVIATMASIYRYEGPAFFIGHGVPAAGAPVTTSNLGLNYVGPVVVALSATDDIAVAHTYYKLDGGVQIGYTAPFTVPATELSALHSLEFWSVDTAGNVEVHKMASFFVKKYTNVAAAHALPTDLVCTASGCHDGGDLTSIHLATGGPGCAACHGAGITPAKDCTLSACHNTNGPHGATHTPVASTTSAPNTCTSCHTAGVVAVHAGGCTTCHGYVASPTSSIPTTRVASVIAAGIAGPDASCESCHTGTQAVIHTMVANTHTATNVGCSVSSGCHSSDVTVIHSSWARNPGCAACHGAGKTPSLVCENCHDNIHDFTHASAVGTKSSACVACHGTDLPAVHEKGDLPGCFCHTNSVFNMNAEMKPLMLAGAAECVDCHKDNFAPHGFGEGTAGGHSTTTFGVVGPFERFDGLDGNPLLKDTQENTVTTTWVFPDVNVFWSEDATTTGEAPSTAKVGLNKESVVTCQDCHTGLDSAMGPQGANEGQVGIDSNYPGAYKYAVLGARKGNTEATSTSGIKFRTTMSDAPGYTGPSADASTGLDPTRNVGNDPREIADGTTGEHAVICAKCHDLFNEGTGMDGWSNGMDDPESIHGMHAGGTTIENTAPGKGFVARGGNQGRTDGRSDCINCHIAIPHGWKRPRLMVNGYTGSYPTSTTAFVGELQSVADPFPYWQGRGQAMANGNSPGNGPTAATDDHLLTPQGVPYWDEQMCIACSAEPNLDELEHGLREPQISNPAKLK